MRTFPCNTFGALLVLNNLPVKTFSFTITTPNNSNSSGVHMGSWKTAMAFADLESENLEEERAK